MAKNISDAPLTIREKVVIRLFLFITQMLAPYEYDHQFKEYYEEMRDLINQK